MLSLLPPERPKLYNRVNIYLLVTKLWLLNLTTILLAFIAGLLPNWGLIFSLLVSIGIAWGIVRGYKVWKKRWVDKKLDEYGQAYQVYASQRIK